MKKDYTDPLFEPILFDGLSVIVTSVTDPFGDEGDAGEGEGGGG